MTQPTLLLSSPEEGATILGDRVTVDATVGEMVMVDYERVKEKKAGFGHLHFWLDQPVAVKESALMHFRNEPYTFTHIPPGEHVLVAEVVNNDHTSFDPPVRTLIHFKTALPQEVKIQRFISSPTVSPVPQFHFTTIAIPLFIAFIFINIGLLIWLVSNSRGK